MDVYYRIFEHAPDPLLVIDEQGRIANANARCESVLGYGRDELIGQPIELLVPDRHVAGHVAHRERYTVEPHTRRMGSVQMDLRVRRKDGSEFPADIMLSPLQGDTGLHILCAVRDVTERLAADEKLRRHSGELEALHEKLQALASHDSLTGLFNRRAFDEQAEWLLRNALRRNECLSILMIDLDFFKQVNDQFGHPEGDRVLVAVGAALRGACRQSDVAARYGGEEFAVALPDTDARGSVVAAENFRAAIAAISGLRVSITASIGAVTFRPPGESPCTQVLLRELVAAVDRALYAAKNSGRDRVCHAEAVGSPRTDTQSGAG